MNIVWIIYILEVTSIIWILPDKASNQLIYIYSV